MMVCYCFLVLRYHMQCSVIGLIVWERSHPITDIPVITINDVNALQETQVALSASVTAAISTRDLQCVMYCSHGSLQISSGSFSNPLSLQGTVSSLNAQLATLQYMPPQYYDGSDVIYVSIRYKDIPDTEHNSTVTVTIGAVNHAPSFTVANGFINISSMGAISITQWATNISAGPTNEQWQTVSFTIQRLSDTFTQFTTLPTISSNGDLQVSVSESAWRAGGIALFSVMAVDDGGTANGGIDQSDAMLLTIRVIRPDPVLYSIVPNHSSVIGGTTITVTGEYFGSGSDVTEVLLCNVNSTIHSQTAQTVTITSNAALDICTGNVTLKTKMGDIVEMMSAFTYDPGM